METLTIRQAEDRLCELGMTLADRDMVIRLAAGAGVSKRRMADLTGLARTTIDRILRERAVGGERV
jgi:hypothetical protein